MIELSLDQKNILLNLEKWFYNIKKDEKVLNNFRSFNKDNYTTLGGFAGTGKSTLVSIFRKDLNDKYPKLKVVFCSYTGKATRVLKTKLVESQAIYSQDTVGTIHSVIYSPEINDKKEIVGWKKKDSVDADLIIVDEASMVDRDIWEDLLRYSIPILAVGDHGQLPPIKGKFNLMQAPQFRLEKIHRQAEENPIIQLSIMARENGVIPVGKYGNRIVKLSRGSSDSQEIVGELLQNFKKDTLVLCGYNTTRIKTNKYIRQCLEFESELPEVRDRVICLRNNHEKGIFNGMMGNISSISQDYSDKQKGVYDVSIEMDGESELYKGYIAKNQFNSVESLNFGENRSKYEGIDLFDFGYCITVHKAQGSQSKRVILFEERFKQLDEESWKQWLYTAVTRAEKELYIIG